MICDCRSPLTSPALDNTLTVLHVLQMPALEDDLQSDQTAEQLFGLQDGLETEAMLK